MAALSIIKHFEIFNDFLCGLVSCGVLTMMNEVPFQGTKEALDAGIVPTGSSPRHAPSYARGPQALLIGICRVRSAPIGMVEHAWLRLTPMQRPLKGVLRQLLREPNPHGPAHHGS